ncbi:MAG TPA: precorrin-6A synthase (deacetylating) [Pelagibacterium sp.]|uniref:precorrin-6A synthase (deacetylating) n=1 Tax=Pelagibacterium sp. TaxID=1967288 RepID=UPI002B750A21|nr:precorrin-6A synthase (deacetylating) [Pelagibacterium sp.]HWJ88109.1 precorrin-6A synthase (deacetylating) [Pelagibacterium sp.]
MRKIVVIGIGTGNPEHMTMEGLTALRSADVLFVPTKGEDKAQLAAVRHAIVERFAAPGLRVTEFALPVRDAANPSYEAGVADWHDAIAGQYRTMIADMDESETAALLVWGDPGLYDSTLRILERVRALGEEFSIRVVPGITAIAALTAAFAIPLNSVGNPVIITTGRKLAQGWPEGADSVVVMLDGKQTFASIDPEGLHIYWAGYVGMSEQILIEGALSEVSGTIAKTREAARAEHGWIMDIYLLRRAVGR